MRAAASRAFGSGRRPEALKLATQALAISPNDAQTRALLGQWITTTRAEMLRAKEAAQAFGDAARVVVIH